jgi:RND family efflux transporter MFP subunit
MRHPRWLPVGLLILFVALGCGQGQKQTGDAPPPKVEVSAPLIDTVTDYEEFTGRTDAVKTVELKAQVTGYLQEVRFKEGDKVTQDQVLFVIDDRTFQADLKKAQADVAKAKAQIKLSEARLTQANAQLARARRLGIGRGNITPEEYDKIVADREEAAATVTANKATQASAEAAVAVAQLNVDFTRIKAPFDGRMSRALIDPGNLVKKEDTALSTIVTLGQMYAYFDVDERSMLRFRRLLHQGKIQSARETTVHVEMALADEQGFPHQGTINFIDNRLDPNSGTLRVRGLFKDPNNFFSAGMFARVRVPIGKAHPAVLVPERALGTDQGVKFVYLVEDDKVARRNLKVGRLHGAWREVEEGLTQQEVRTAEENKHPLRIVVSGMQRIRPGVQVTPTPAKKDPPPARRETKVAVTTSPRGK